MLGGRRRSAARPALVSRLAQPWTGRGVSRSAGRGPDAGGDLADQAQLVLLGALADRVARAGRGEAALRRQGELLAGEDAARLADAVSQLVGRLQLAGLRRDEAEHHHLVVGDVTEGSERA